MKRKLAFVLTLLLCFARTLGAACTATEENSNNSIDQSGSSSVSVTAVVNAIGDLVAITAWCGPESSCTPTSVTLGSQTAVQTSVTGTWNSNEGEGFIFYILSANTAGSQTLTFTESGNTSEIQVAYIDFTPSSGCKFSHDVDSPVGSGTGGTINTPSITPSAAGELLFNFTFVSEHITSIGSPWSCTVYPPVEGGTCYYQSTIDADAYVLSSSAGATANNMTNIHTTDTWEAIIASFTISSGSGGNTYYVCAATGSPCNASDSNAGTSKTATWLHAPGMPNATGMAGSVTLQPGDQVIFRGGDTWHFGNSSLTPFTGGTWNWIWSGSSGNNIYVGVDQTWYNSSVCGSSWCRPILNADNPTSTSPTLGACTYQVTANGSQNDIMGMGGSSHVTVDNFEWLGLCANGASTETFGWDVYLEGGSSTQSLFERNYFHGWTHRQFNYPTYQYSGFVWLGSGVGDNYQYNVIDGTDSDPAGFGAFYDAPYDASYNVMNAISQGIGNDCHTFHDNLMMNWVLPGDGNAHGNVYECVSETSGTNLYYNNVFANDYASGGTGAIFWIGPSSGATDYFFHNLIFGTVATGNYFNIQNPSGGNVYAFNSTLQSNGSSPELMDCEGGSKTHAINMHFVGTTSPYYGGGTCSTTTVLAQTNATANGQGYTATEAYAYSPASSSGGTVGTGTNERSLCATINSIDTTAGAACQSDTGYACTYNAANHTVSCPARTPVARPTSTPWDIGAFQYSGTQTSAPNPPTGLTASVQ